MQPDTPHTTQQDEEAWGICVGCFVYEPVSKLNEEGLCFWCTPEGKAQAAELFGAGYAAVDALTRAHAGKEEG